MSKSFISYCHRYDDDKRIILDKLLRASHLYPIIVASRNKPSMLLAAKVEQAIEEADYLIPILTEKSIQNQWVNQEIGYAHKLLKENKIKIVPIVEETVMDKLKGFIHKQMDLPFIFNGNAHNGVENKAFKAQCIKLIKYLKSKGVPKKYTTDLNATFSFLSAAMYENNLNLNSTMILENIGNKTITIRDILISIPLTYNKYSGYKKKETATRKVTYETDHYVQSGRKISLKFQAMILKPREVKKLLHLKFTPIKYIPYKIKEKMCIELDSHLDTMDSVNVTFVLLSGDTFEKNVTVLHPKG
jgi:hypothetical protein